MNQRATLFEVSAITFFIGLGTVLPSVNIDNAGVLSVAGILTLIALTNHHKALTGLGSLLALKTGIASDYNQRNSEK